MISNKHGIEIFYTAFKEACGDEYDHHNNHGYLDNSKFYYAIILLSKVLFSHEPAPFEAMFSNMLVDKLLTGDHKCKFQNFNHLYFNLVIGGRLPKSDPDTNIAVIEILSGDAIKVNLAFMD
jgi:hypothetical protein